MGGCGACGVAKAARQPRASGFEGPAAYEWRRGGPITVAGVRLQRAPHRSGLARRPDGLPEPLAFADSLTADHKILNEADESRSSDQVALVIYDWHTQ